MSVSDSVTLPAQPTTGSTQIIGLAGNGRVAPHSMQVAEITLASDASGGDCLLTINLDARYENIVTWCDAQQISAAAASPYQFDLDLRPDTVSIASNGTSSNDGGLVLAGINGASWNPPPLPNMRRIRLTMANVDTETTSLTIVVFNFEMDASKNIPLQTILSSLPRAGVSFP